MPMFEAESKVRYQSCQVLRRRFVQSKRSMELVNPYSVW